MAAAFEKGLYEHKIFFQFFRKRSVQAVRAKRSVQAVRAKRSVQAVRASDQCKRFK
jgi:hypothetical protein